MKSLDDIIDRTDKLLSEKRVQQVLERVYLKNGETDFIDAVNDHCVCTNVTRWIEKLYLYMNNTCVGVCSCGSQVWKYSHEIKI